VPLADIIREPESERMTSKLFWLLFLFVPLSLWLGVTGASAPVVFFTSCLAVIPLAGLMGRGTEHLTRHVGPGLGGLISSSFGNAAELILAFIALREGHLDVVKASLTGSIIGNMLLVLGLSMLVGGWRHKELRFSRAAAESNSSMMFLAVVALVIPAIYARISEHRHPEHIESLSLYISAILMVTYAASLVFSLRSHRHLFRPEVDPAESDHRDADGPAWSVGRSIATLVIAAAGVAVVAEFLVGAVEAAGAALGLGDVFMGVVVLALVGNAAENSTAVQMAMRNQMDLSLAIAVGSSMQIAIFVAPLLVFAGHVMGRPLGLEFTVLEVTAVMLSVGTMTLLIRDGRTNWFEGLQLLAVYAILAMAFYFI
jgi:Ca2+:H+ antiporter